MDDPFFAAASNLDKLLDEFEENEADDHRVAVSNAEGHIHAKQLLTISDSRHAANGGTPVDVGKADRHESFDEKNNPTLEHRCGTSTVDLLIDFASPNVTPPIIQEAEASESTLKELDFLLTLTPASEDVSLIPTSVDKAISLDTEKVEELQPQPQQTLNQYLKDDTEPESSFHAEINKDNGNVSHVLMSDKQKKVNSASAMQSSCVTAPVGFSKSIDVDEQEFHRFFAQDTEELVSSDGQFVSQKGNYNDPKAAVKPILDELEPNTVGQQSVSEVTGNNCHHSSDPSISLPYTSHSRNIKSDSADYEEANALSGKSTQISAVIQNSADTRFSSCDFADSNQDQISRTAHNSNHSEDACTGTCVEILSESTGNAASPNETVQNMEVTMQPTASICDHDVNLSDDQQTNHYPSSAPPPYSSIYGDNIPVLHSDGNVTSLGNDQDITLAQRYSFSSETTHQQPCEMNTENLADHPVSSSSSVQQVRRPGRTKPRWVPDENSPVCTNCGQKFTFTKRRHHCRACGRVFCSACCSSKSKLEYLNAEARVCISCYIAIVQADALAEAATNHAEQAVPSTSSASATPPSRPETAARPVPKGSDDSNDNHGKQVRFSDGTKPDHPSTLPATPPLPSRMSRSRIRNGGFEVNGSSLPPLIVECDEAASIAVEESPDPDVVLTMLQSSSSPIRFALSANLFVFVRQVLFGAMSCNYFISHGLDTVGQAEVALLLNADASSDKTVFIQVFTLYTHLFTSARKGKAVHFLDFLLFSDIYGTEEMVLGCSDNVGILFVRRTCQDIDCLTDSSSPSTFFESSTVQYSSTLFVLLVHQQEKPWATLFPSRLLLGLAAQSQQYPYPLSNNLSREPVYAEVSNTILAILCDFRNYKYHVVSIPGLSVTIKDTGVTITIPINRFSDIVKILNSSNEHVLALGSDTFTVESACRSQLVCIQDKTKLSYHTHVLCAPAKDAPFDNSTSASFVVFNGSLKSGSSHQAKCTIVEDGVMIQLLPEKMASLKESLKAMDDFRISCLRSAVSSSAKAPPASQEQNTSAGDSEVPPPAYQSVEVQWIGDDTKFNIGLSSPIDFQSFEGVVGYNVQGKSEKKGKHQILRWNQVFFFKSTGDVLDMSRLSEQMADGCFQALVPHMKLLRNSRQTKVGIRLTIHSDDVGYKVGSRGLPLPEPCLNALDEHLVFLLHEASAHLHPEDEGVEFELIFCVLEVRPNWKVVQPS